MKFVSYLKVDLQEDGFDELDNQRCAVSNYLKDVKGELIAEYVEEIQRWSRYTMLKKAISHCLDSGGTLLVPKIIGLEGNKTFLSLIKESGVDFAACDLPTADSNLVTSLLRLAEEKSNFLSKRTKAGLKLAKEHGKKLGGVRERSDRLVKPFFACKIQGDEKASDLEGTISQLYEQGLSLTAIARKLNEKEIKTPRGGNWSATQVGRVLTHAGYVRKE